MRMFDRAINFLGGHAIVGGYLPIAAGVGFAIRYEDRQRGHPLLLRRRLSAAGRVSTSR